MAAYAFTPLTLNGVALNSGNLQSWFTIQNGPGIGREFGAVEADVTNLGPVDVRGQPKASVWELHVTMLALNQTDLKAIFTTFNEEAGPQLLRITDGDAAVWRVSVRVLALRALTTNHYVAVLRVAAPVWEADTLTTDTKSNQSGDSVAITLTNNGNRKCRPTFSITPNSAKASMYDSVPAAMRGFIVNRAPDDWINLPVYLFDSGSAAARLATNTSGSDTTVIRTTGATTLNGAIGAGDATITLTALGAAFSPNGGIAYISDGGNSEQISYSGTSGLTLTGCVRGIGGTVAIGHATGLTISPSGTLVNGNDVRVWVEDVEYSRWLVAWNSAASDVVINMTMPRAILLTLTADMTASQTSVKFVEGSGQLPDTGYLAVQNEVFYYASNDGDGVSGIVRGVWSTIAATHTAAQIVYANPRQFWVTAGQATAGAPPSPTTQRPAIQLPASSNQQWRYGDGADDASTIFYDPAAPARSAQWVPGFELDGNAIAPLIQLSVSTTGLTFKDDVPGDGSPPYNYAELQLPQGVRNGLTSAFSADWTPAVEILNLELHMRDGAGTYKLIDQLQQSAAAAGRVLPATLSAIAYAVKLKARYNIATGHRGTGGTLVFTGAGQGYRQHFTLTKETLVYGIQFYGANTGAGTESLNVWINEESHAATLGRLHFAQTIAISDTTPQMRQVLADVPVRLAAGTYAVVLGVNGAHVVNFNVGARAGARYYHLVEDGAGAPVTTQTMWFTILTAYAPDLSAPIENDQPVRAATTGLRTGTTATFDKVVINPKPTQFPFVHRVNVFLQNTYYHCTALISNAATGDSIAVDKMMLLSSALVIDCGRRLAEYTEQGVKRPVPRSITPSNASDWMPIIAGANALTFADPNMVSTTIVTTKRDAKV